jgi:hypothetical protein
MRSARRLSSSSASRGAVAGEARPKHLSVSHFRLRLTSSTASAGVEIVPTACSSATRSSRRPNSGARRDAELEDLVTAQQRPLRLERLLREVEVAEEADQVGEDPGPLVATTSAKSATGG